MQAIRVRTLSSGGLGVCTLIWLLHAPSLAQRLPTTYQNNSYPNESVATSPPGAGAWRSPDGQILQFRSLGTTTALPHQQTIVQPNYRPPPTHAASSPARFIQGQSQRSPPSFQSQTAAQPQRSLPSHVVTVPPSAMTGGQSIPRNAQTATEQNTGEAISRHEVVAPIRAAAPQGQFSIPIPAQIVAHYSSSPVRAQTSSFATQPVAQQTSESGEGLSLLDEGAEASDSDDALLETMGPAQSRQRLPGAAHGSAQPSREGVPEGVDPHAEVFANSCYPSAMTCAKCHQQIYDEWRVSAHAYAALSPMFHKFEQKITELSMGTVGTFCMRCHAPVAMQMNFPRNASIIDAPQVFREGVTCVACHRVKEAYGRVHGERRIEPGPLQAPVFGGIGGSGVAQVIAEKDAYKIKLDPNDKKPGQEIHSQGIKFEQLGNSGFCQACHQVAVHPGISLEVVWAQYRAGPACKKGISCQDCHMGLVPGKPQGYSYGPAAVMSGKSVNNHRKHSNHMFFGPGNSIAHPGLFPHNEKALRWRPDQWFEFDWRAGWGTPEFEKAVASKQIAVNFPQAWDSTDERRDARKVLDENFKLLDLKKASAIAVMEAGSHVDGPVFHEPPSLGEPLNFHYVVRNISEGHNNPSGSLGAQPQLWLNVVLTGPRGNWLWESGYLDGNGDLANHHSLQVRQNQIKWDRQLFNLQTQFLITGVKGTDREMYLPVNVDIDQAPFLRPGNIPFSVMNHPPFIRMEQKSIPPLGHKKARYRVPGYLMRERGTYRLSVRMRSRMEPLYFLKFVGATPEMERRQIEQTIDLHPYAVTFTIP